jgi:hypothetical protein
MSSRTDSPTFSGWAESGNTAGQTFAQKLAASGNSNSVLNQVLHLESETTANQWDQLRRMFVNFVTTSPLDSPLATITAAQLTFTPSVVDADTFGQSIVLGSAVLASPTAIASADYEGTRSSVTSYGTARIAVTSLTAGVQSSFTFNSTGLSYLNTQFGAGNPILLGVRWSCDIDEIEPTWSSGVTQTINFNNTFQLVMTYSVAPGNVVVSLTGTLANAADTVQCNYFTVELFT